ncbi:phytoene desaturase family protein [Clostridium grantii]|uniref:Phytoene dehydrogenase-related protein n=1 Tax=Clostridium grantii DSM 8605 TaxID=1121316 RepID=A0A1M5VM28_9CLOT|nr:NAD(P)/FAD-dependent oxidoreductase [Clostridium grantii]SHH76228.1 Phytoene dehydrogenase-related protein [Clostridium grantii DSM 8605]
MKKVIIIGAGISGLSAGIFARKNGLDAEIFEMHSLPGGECTGWNRNGYHFDNCIHWLTGTKKGTGLYEVWKELGAFENTDVYTAEYFFACNKEGRTLYMYKDLIKLEKHLKDISSEDKNQIENFIALIEKFQSMEVPIEKSIDMMNIIDYIKMAKKYGALGKDLKSLNKISVKEYASKFKNTLIGEALMNIVPHHFPASIIFFTLASFTSGNGGWPMGGSLKMSLRIENKFKTLGGKVNYNTKVQRIIVHNGSAVGIELENGQVVQGDYIISAVDANMLVTNLLEGKYKDKVFDKQFANEKSYSIFSSVDIGIGVACDLSHRAHRSSYEVPPFKCGKKTVDRIDIRHFCHEENFAPKGASVIRVTITDYEYEYWKILRETNKEKYDNEKKAIAYAIMKRLELIYPETKDKVETFDINTPITYERYCGAYKGAYMSFIPLPKVKSLYQNGKIQGINNLYVAGQWIMSPGGLPVACVSGKWAVQKIYKIEKYKQNSKN